VIFIVVIVTNSKRKYMKDNCLKVLVLCLFLLVSYSDFAGAQSQNNEAVIEIEKEELLPVYRMDPFPSSGVVMYNSPSFVCQPKIKKPKGLDTFVFDYSYQYMFRISQDESFPADNTILSDTLDWTIFNTHRKLHKGQWYWQYAYVKNNEAVWQESIGFEITGEEVAFVSPSVDQIISRIGNEHPRIFGDKSQIGNIHLPAEMLDVLHRHVDRTIGKPLPALIYADKKVMTSKRKELSAERYQMFITKRTRDKCKDFAAKNSEVVMLYFITGDKKYLDEALRRYRYFNQVYQEILAINQYNDFTEVAFHTVMADVFDIAYDYLSDDERSDIVAAISKSQEHIYHQTLHKPGHVLHDSHFWQIELRSFFQNALLLINHTPKAKKWLAYAYELYVVRAPTGGGKDGGWAPGNKYFGANAETLFVLPYLLTKISDFDFFSKPWYRSVSEYLAYTSPIAHVSSNFGDGTDAKENMYPFVEALHRIKPDAYAEYYVSQYKKYGGKRRSSKISKIDWYSYQPLNIKKDNKKAVLSQAKLFKDVGTVAMHTNLYNPNKNVMLAFRSSPYGVVGHSHAAQNAFNIQFGGEPLFFRTGYYTSWADLHSLHSYRHTRAHNSILVDGLGQNFHSSGYGWIARFISSDKISYALGDASRAYSGTLYRDAIKKMMKKYDVDETELGLGDPGLKTFRRHISMIEEGVVMIYDVLEANHPVDWTFVANSREEILTKQANAWYCKSEKSQALMQIFNKSDFTRSITDQFYSPAIDWQGKAKKLNMLKDCWHAKAKIEKSTKARFLTLIQVGDLSKELKILEPSGKNRDLIIKDWIIKAELDVDKAPSFLIEKKDKISLSYGYNILKLDGHIYKVNVENSTVLLKMENGKMLSNESVDELPDAAIYY